MQLICPPGPALVRVDGKSWFRWHNPPTRSVRPLRRATSKFASCRYETTWGPNAKPPETINGAFCSRNKSWTNYLIHHNRPTVYSKTIRYVFCNTATGGQAPVVGFCNTPTGGLKARLKRVKMPGYTGILSPRTYLSSSLHLQLADSLFKPTFAMFSLYFNFHINQVT